MGFSSFDLVQSGAVFALIHNLTESLIGHAMGALEAAFPPGQQLEAIKKIMKFEMWNAKEVYDHIFFEHVDRAGSDKVTCGDWINEGPLGEIKQKALYALEEDTAGRNK